jgi:hypothetical protein
MADGMNFSKLPPSGIPLWWLLFKGEKTVTRRPPACLHCGKKWWEHTHSDRGMMCLPDQLKKVELEKAGGIRFYKPDLSRWQPKETVVDRSENEVAMGEEERTIAICPGRGKKAICRNCGGLEGWHGHTDPLDEPFVNRYRTDFGVTINICSHYEPFRLKVKSVMMESEWENQMRQFFTGKPDRNFNVLPWETCLKHEATREGFNGDWNALQEALYGKGGYSKGTPLARIEFEKVV